MPTRPIRMVMSLINAKPTKPTINKTQNFSIKSSIHTMKLLPFKLYYIIFELKHQKSNSSVGLESLVGTSFFFDVFLKLRGFAHPLFLGSK